MFGIVYSHKFTYYHKYKFFIRALLIKEGSLKLEEGGY